MATLLILGSRPEPMLPPLAAIDALACANGSGYSASRHGLPTPSYTVMSAILATTASGRHTLEALRGLSTDTLIFMPRPRREGGLRKQFFRWLREFRARPWFLHMLLRRVDYRYRELIVRHSVENRQLVEDFCDHDAELLAQVRRKQPSTGVMALLIGMAGGEYDRFILSGFSFELTHAYGDNPEIRERGTQVSRHADTDIAVLQALATRSGRLYTTEPRVHEAAGIPLLDGVAAPSGCADTTPC